MGVLLWTVLMLAATVALAVIALASLANAQQACFFGAGSVPCPDGQDWRVRLFTFALFGVPAIWLIGVGVAIAGWVLVSRRRGSRP